MIIKNNNASEGQYKIILKAKLVHSVYYNPFSRYTSIIEYPFTSPQIRTTTIFHTSINVLS